MIIKLALGFLKLEITDTIIVLYYTSPSPKYLEIIEGKFALRDSETISFRTTVLHSPPINEPLSAKE